MIKCALVLIAIVLLFSYSLLEFCTRRRQFPSAPPIQWTTSLDECVKWDAAERQAAAQSAAQAAAGTCLSLVY
jgi:uncharacterized membrane protein